MLPWQLLQVDRRAPGLATKQFGSGGGGRHFWPLKLVSLPVPLTWDLLPAARVAGEVVPPPR